MFLALEDILNDTQYSIDLPSKKSEKWHLCNINKFLDQHYTLIEKREKDTFIEPKEGFWIYMLDGEYIKSNLPQSVKSESFKKALKVKNNPFSYLAATHAISRLEFVFSEAIKLEVYVHFSKESFLTSAFNIIVKEGVNVDINLSFKAGEKSFITHNSYVELYPRAVLNLTQIQNFDPEAIFISQNSLLLHEHALCKSFSFLYKGQQLQNFIEADLGFKSEIDVSSLLLGNERQKQMFSCDITHKADKSESKVRSKQVVRDSATAIFDATTCIEKDTKGTVAYQSNQALLLDEKAQVHAKPHLEIYSDDLTASHGSTVGELNEQAISYIVSRGISETKAREILVEAFMNELLDEVNPQTQTKIRKLIGGSDEK